MEPPYPQFMAPDLTVLPHSIFMDFTEEFLPLRNLLIEFFPYYTEREMEKTVKKMIAAISHNQDIEYCLAEFSTQIMEDCFIPYNCASEAKLFEVQQLLMSVGRNVFNKISAMSCYVSGIFPYNYAGMRHGSEVFLRNGIMLNYDIEMNSRPFHFAI